MRCVLLVASLWLCSRSGVGAGRGLTSSASSGHTPPGGGFLTPNHSESTPETMKPQLQDNISSWLHATAGPVSPTSEAGYGAWRTWPIAFWRGPDDPKSPGSSDGAGYIVRLAPVRQVSPGSGGPIDYDNELKGGDGDSRLTYLNSTKQTLIAMGGGTGAGANVGGAKSPEILRDLLLRMRTQDKAAMCLIIAVYFVALAFSASLTYQRASLNSPIKYFAYPRRYTAATESRDIHSFLEAFNQPPKRAHLQITGFLPIPDSQRGSVQWRNNHYEVVFDFSLDLSPWVVQEPAVAPAGGEAQARSLRDGVEAKDHHRLRSFLALDTNDLAVVEMQKSIGWPGWEELATNIKHKIRQHGFTGVVSVNRCEKECMIVRKNRQWANFMHNPTTWALSLLSIVGWLAFLPYMWVRCYKLVVRSHFRVDVGIADYWRLIADSLGAGGFVGTEPGGAAEPHAAQTQNVPLAS